MKSGLLANFLKQKRVAAGLSQKIVSEKLGYSTPQFISNWERGISCPPISSLKALGVIYGVNPDQLFEVLLNQSIQEITLDLKRKFASSKLSSKQGSTR